MKAYVMSDKLHDALKQAMKFVPKVSERIEGLPPIVATWYQALDKNKCLITKKRLDYLVRLKAYDCHLSIGVFTLSDDNELVYNEVVIGAKVEREGSVMIIPEYLYGLTLPYKHAPAIRKENARRRSTRRGRKENKPLPKIRPERVDLVLTNDLLSVKWSNVSANIMTFNKGREGLLSW